MLSAEASRLVVGLFLPCFQNERVFAASAAAAAWRVGGLEGFVVLLVVGGWECTPCLGFS